MSRLPFESVISHAAETPNSLGIDPIPGVGRHGRIFRRDCLEVCVGKLYAFISHFKAPYPETHYLWRAVDHEGEVLEVFATKRRDRRAALKFEVVTDKIEATFDKGVLTIDLPKTAEAKKAYKKIPIRAAGTAKKLETAA
jgi:hypothetical protein